MAPAPKHRDALVYAAMTLFRRQGYAATGLAEILSVSGAPKGSLYHYFPDGKEAIGEAALQRATEDAGRAMLARMAVLKDAADVMRSHGGAFIVDLLRSHAASMAAGLEESGFADGCAIATIALEAAPHSKRLSAAACMSLNKWSKSLARMMESAGVAPARAAELGDVIVSSIEGALILARVRQDTAVLLRVGEEMARLVSNEFSVKGTVQ